MVTTIIDLVRQHPLEYAKRYGDALLGRMQAEDAKDTSDAEIERTLAPCVCGPMLVTLAQEMRALGMLNLSTPAEIEYTSWLVANHH